MEPARVSVAVYVFCYGGNGGVASVSPELMVWLCRLMPKIKADPRVLRVTEPQIFSDTPITMMRNRAIKQSREGGFDIVLMLDNDNIPDAYVREGSDARPFWDEAFGFAYDRLVKGMPTVVAAPYCGPPPPAVDTPGIIHGGEVPYIFQWTNRESDNPHSRPKLEMFTRTEAARLSGIYPIAAAPTGCCLFTIDAFEGMKPPHFYYEMDDEQTEKRSTEDVTCTRDLSLFWKLKGIDVLFGAMDSWALHVKPKQVGRPQFVPIESVGQQFAEAIRNDHSAHERVRYVDFTANLPRGGVYGQVLAEHEDQVAISDEFIAERMRADAERDGQGTIRNDDTDIDEDDLPPPTEEDREATDRLQAKIAQALETAQPIEKKNGHAPAVRQRRIGNRLVTVMGREIPDESLHTVEALSDWVSDDRGRLPLSAAVVHSDVGQSAAAIVPHLPDGSHLYCLDNLGAREYGLDKATHFQAAFQEELITGRVMADIEGRNFPMPNTPQDLDLVFIERYVTNDLLELWKRHLKADGVLAGYAGTENEQKSVQEFAEANGLVAQLSESVFAVPMEVPESV